MKTVQMRMGGAFVVHRLLGEYGRNAPLKGGYKRALCGAAPTSKRGDWYTVRAGIDPNSMYGQAAICKKCVAKASALEAKEASDANS